MRLPVYRRRHHEELDARVEDARRSAEDAQAEAALSERRYQSVRDHVVGPLKEAGSRNSFAEMVRISLTNGYGGGGHP